MKAFIIKLDRAPIACECYVQQIGGKTEDIFIVNLKDSHLIRQFNGSKIIFHLRKQAVNHGMALEDHLWETIMYGERSTNDAVGIINKWEAT